MRNLLYTFAVAIFIALMSSCEKIESEGLIVDWTPVSFYIAAEDADGNDIIKEEMPGMTLKFKGEEYTVKKLEDIHPYTKAYMPYMYGLCFMGIEDYPGNPSNVLFFGEIDGAADMDEDIILKWPDGSKNVIHYHCSDHNERKISCKRSWTVDGRQLQENNNIIFHFVKAGL